jgi:hypothetical protein
LDCQPVLEKKLPGHNSAKKSRTQKMKKIYF